MDIRQTNCPSRNKGGSWGVLGGHKFKTLGKLSNWHQLWFTSADSSGNGHRLNTSRLSITQGAFGGGGGGKGVTNSNVWESCQTGGPIGTKFGTHLQIRLGIDIGYIQFAPQYPGGICGGGGG